MTLAWPLGYGNYGFKGIFLVFRQDFSLLLPILYTKPSTVSLSSWALLVYYLASPVKQITVAIGCEASLKIGITSLQQIALLNYGLIDMV